MVWAYTSDLTGYFPPGKPCFLAVILLFAVYLVNRDFKIQPPGRQRERKKPIGFVNKTRTLLVHHAFLYISVPVFARPRRENA